MTLQIYSGIENPKSLIFKGKIDEPSSMRHYILDLIAKYNLGFDDKLRFNSDETGILWFRVIGATVNGETIPYLAIDLDNPGQF